MSPEERAAFEKGPELLVGIWEAVSAGKYDDSQGKYVDIENPDYVVTFLDDGTLSGDFSGTWEYSDYSKEMGYEYYVEYDGMDYSLGIYIRDDRLSMTVEIDGEYLNVTLKQK